MEHEHVIKNLFSSIDDKDLNNFSAFLSDDCSFRFGNAPVVSGRQQVESYVSAFFESIDSLSHTVADAWHLPECIICHGTVSYTRHDKSVLTVPFSNILKLKGDRICEYLIFADTSTLYA